MTGFCLANPKLTGEREQARQMLERRPANRPAPGTAIVTDKGLSGEDTEAFFAGPDLGLALISPARKDEKASRYFPNWLRQRVEAIIWTLKNQLGLERHGGRVPAGLYLQRHWLSLCPALIPKLMVRPTWTLGQEGIASLSGATRSDMIAFMPPSIRVRAIVLDCPDPLALSGFYAALLGWPPDPEPSEDNYWAELSNPDCSVKIEFQRVDSYQPPTWPDGERPQMLHIDLRVTDLDAEHERALRIGAQLLSDESRDFRVYADPSGHPFCLCAVDLPN